MTSASEGAINSTDDLRANLLDEENELWQVDSDAEWPEKSVGSLSFASEETNPDDYLHADVFNCTGDGYWLAMGIRESLKESNNMSTKSNNMSTQEPSQEPNVHQGFQDQNSNNKQFSSGLDALAEACNTVADQF